MVSARAGVGPAYAIRRTAAAAPVTTFPPRIPNYPFIPFAGSSALEPGDCLIPSQCPSIPYAPSKPVGTPRRTNVVETLDVRHPGHTSDSEQDFNSRAYSFRVKPAPALSRVVPTGPRPNGRDCRPGFRSKQNGPGLGARKRTPGAAQVRAKPAPWRRKAPGSRNLHG